MAEKGKDKARNKGDDAARSPVDALDPDEQYGPELRELQIELVKLQREVIEAGRRILLIFEGRDAAGKDGTIKRIIEHLSPRDIRVVALPKPSDRESSEWYFQRYVAHLPASGEIVLLNRSWYNRAGVERVMGFCSDDEYGDFMRNVVPFERMLAGSGILIVKYYLDISRKVQKHRLEARRHDPLKQWKISPIDDKAVKHWDDYSAARDTMLRGSDSGTAPWVVVRADDKKAARLAVIRDIIGRIAYRDADRGLAHPDQAVLRRFDPTQIGDFLSA